VVQLVQAVRITPDLKAGRAADRVWICVYVYLSRGYHSKGVQYARILPNKFNHSSHQAIQKGLTNSSTILLPRRQSSNRPSITMCCRKSKRQSRALADAAAAKLSSMSKQHQSQQETGIVGSSQTQNASRYQPEAPYQPQPQAQTYPSEKPPAYTVTEPTQPHPAFNHMSEPGRVITIDSVVDQWVTERKGREQKERGILSDVFGYRIVY
jgi:hypothetical protein